MLSGTYMYVRGGVHGDYSTDSMARESSRLDLGLYIWDYSLHAILSLHRRKLSFEPPLSLKPRLSSPNPQSPPRCSYQEHILA